jgi:hypothetical protein
LGALYVVIRRRKGPGGSGAIKYEIRGDSEIEAAKGQQLSVVEERNNVHNVEEAVGGRLRYPAEEAEIVGAPQPDGE